MSCNCPKCSYTNDDTNTNTLAELRVAVEEIQQKLAPNNNSLPLSPTEFAKMMNNQPKILINLYCELTWKMQAIKIPVKDTTISNRAYISILAPGTVVKFNGRHYFYSCPAAMMSLEGSWINDECTSYSTYEFLREVLNDGGAVEVVLEG